MPVAGLQVLIVMHPAIVAIGQRRASHEQRQKMFGEEQIDRSAMVPGICRNMPGITPEQAEQIHALKLKNLKENIQLRNNPGETRTGMPTVSSVDGPGMKAGYKLIDERAALRANKEKNNAATQ